jgi:hypothetical protein
MAKPAKKLFHASMRPGLFGPGVGPELPFTPGSIHDAKTEARDAASAAAAAAQKARENVMPSPDDEASRMARRRQAAKMAQRSGRVSTNLANVDSLG